MKRRTFILGCLELAACSSPDVNTDGGIVSSPPQGNLPDKEKPVSPPDASAPEPETDSGTPDEDAGPVEPPVDPEEPKEPELLSAANVWLKMDHSDAYSELGLSKIKNHGKNGVKGYLLCGGEAIDSAACRRIDYGIAKGWRSHAVYGLGTDPVVRIPLADLDLSRDFTVALVYSNRHQTEANAWATLLQLGPNHLGEAVLPCRNFASESFKTQLGSAVLENTTLCNMGKGSIIIQSSAGVVRSFLNDVELPMTTKTMQIPTADHCFGGGFTGSTYFSSQAGIFELIIWDRQLSPKELDELRDHLKIDSSYEVDLFDGQSNNCGSADVDLLPANWNPDNGVKHYDYFRAQSWTTLEVKNTPTLPGANIGFGPWLAYQHYSRRDVLIGGRNGTSIAAWMPMDETVLSEEIYDTMARGLWHRSGLPSWGKCFLHQGETDAESLGAAELYEARLRRYLRYRRELIGRSDLKVVTTSLPLDANLLYLDQINQAKEKLASESAALKVIKVPTGMLRDDFIHFTALGQLYIGEKEALIDKV